jgi:hypothetical protein
LAKQQDELVLQWQEPAGQFEPGRWADAPSRTVLDNLQTFEVWTRMDAQSKWVQTNIQRETPGSREIGD